MDFLLTPMPTFYSLYQEYRKDPRSIELSKKKYKELHQRVKFNYDSWPHRQPVEYLRFTDDAGETWEVRNYPDSFAAKMKFLIIDFCERYKKNLAANEAVNAPNEPPKANPVPHKRKRKPIPVYSMKKIN